MVCPSRGALATNSAPIVPDAPGLFSTTNGWSHRAWSFGASSRLYENADALLGMTPGQYRKGGAGLAIPFASAPSKLGTILIGATGRGICFLGIGANGAAL